MVDRAPASDLIALPELWPTGYFAFDRYEAEAESIEVLSIAGAQEQILTSTIDLSQVDHVRRTFPVLADRRPELTSRGELSNTARGP